jgi:hypothetical protein
MSSSKKGQIESAKIVIIEVFSRFWFRIPDYQRAYVWGKDEISELIDDVNYASEHNPEGQYFLGSMVLRKATRTTDGVSFEEYELLDGQQRLTTLMLMLACIRDRVTDAKLKGACREMLYQEENKWKKSRAATASSMTSATTWALSLSATSKPMTDRSAQICQASPPARTCRWEIWLLACKPSMPVFMMPSAFHLPATLTVLLASC